MDLHSTIRKILKEETQEPKILKFPSLEFFDEDREVAWNIIQKIIERKGNPPYSIEGNLNLRGIPIQSLGNLQSVGGYLNLANTPIESLGNLTSVGGGLNLRNTPIESLGNLQSVGENLDLSHTGIESLDNLESVGGDLILNLSSIRKLSDLKYVGGDIDLRSTPLGEFLKEQLPHEVLKEFRKYIDVQGNVFYRS
jgi:hypothetical protein